jgi:hypothetical protein
MKEIYQVEATDELWWRHEIYNKEISIRKVRTTGLISII